MTATDERTAAYLGAAHPQPHPLLLELEQHARKDRVPTISRETGRLLSTIVHAMQASRILEIGTGYGYATLWMALAQPRMGRIWTIDPDVAHTNVARTYFQHAGEDDFIEIFNTPALELLENFPHRNLDIVLLAAKDERRAYLDLAIPMLKLSGLIVVDDCLLGGRVAVAEETLQSTDAAAARTFNHAFLNHTQLDATILPLGTGIGARRR